MARELHEAWARQIGDSSRFGLVQVCVSSSVLLLPDLIHHFLLRRPILHDSCGVGV
jgi:hypothetical protein